jgi:hypothetical protein
VNIRTVDVLAVMDRNARDAWIHRVNADGMVVAEKADEGSDAAYNAVVALVEAAKAMADSRALTWTFPERKEQLRAALAPFGGAP